MEFYSAKELRFTGHYKWWAQENEVKDILAKLSNTVTFADIKGYLEKQTIRDKDYYCIYVGIANPKPILARVVGQHISGNPNQSTFRKTLTAIFGIEKVDDFIDKLFVGFEKMDIKEELKDFETNEINSGVHILNIYKNNYNSVKDKVLREKLLKIKNKLKDMRSEL